MSTNLRDLTARISFKDDNGLEKFDKKIDATTRSIMKMGASFAGALGIGFGVGKAVEFANEAERADFHFRMATNRFGSEWQEKMRAAGEDMRKNLSLPWEKDGTGGTGINFTALIKQSDTDEAAALFFKSFEPTPARMEIFSTLSQLAARRMVAESTSYMESFSAMLNAATTGDASALDMFGKVNMEFIRVFNSISTLLKDDGAFGIVAVNTQLARFNEVAKSVMKTLDPVLGEKKLEFTVQGGLTTTIEKLLAKLAEAGLEKLGPAIEALTTWLQKILDDKEGVGAAVQKEVPLAAATVAAMGGPDLPPSMRARARADAPYPDMEVLRVLLMDLLGARPYTIGELEDQKRMEMAGDTTGVAEHIRNQSRFFYNGDRAPIEFNGDIIINGAQDATAVVDELMSRTLGAADLTAVTAPGEGVPK